MGLIPKAQVKVTTIIPFYNDARWVDEAIESALCQDGVSHEVIVVDDGSAHSQAVALEILDTIEEYVARAGEFLVARNILQGA